MTFISNCIWTCSLQGAAQTKQFYPRVPATNNYLLFWLPKSVIKYSIATSCNLLVCTGCHKLPISQIGNRNALSNFTPRPVHAADDCVRKICFNRGNRKLDLFCCYNWQLLTETYKKNTVASIIIASSTQRLGV